ncbi:hypothetical protein [Blastopirellula marina]|uniref:Uncharacterized protein n=1 Tax=Blastopirellula marina TaxID=124 RepID=A0A2S8G8U6_9BACT|nr:hypothetical protein [Blastopirellula marina]PQO40882.1 hypothetical protein C5Y98_04705 [Blastopirellula marina]PTL45764.1 hypothetical protein C5Y97_04705 [Blastopirellula marina]
MFLQLLPFKTQQIFYVLFEAWIGAWLHRTLHAVIDSSGKVTWQEVGWSFLFEGILPILCVDFLVGGVWGMLWLYWRIQGDDTTG